MKSTKFIIMHPDDNCATSLVDIADKEELKLDNIIIRINHFIPIGHKFALKNINKGGLVKKYGENIGVTTEDIKIGDWIHTHNLISHYLIEVLNK